MQGADIGPGRVDRAAFRRPALSGIALELRQLVQPPHPAQPLGHLDLGAGRQGARARHGTVVSRAELEHVLDRLAALTPAERAAVPGLNPQRADIIVAGLAVAAEVLAVFEGYDGESM